MHLCRKHTTASPLGKGLSREAALKLQQEVWRKLRIFYAVAYRYNAGARHTSDTINQKLRADHQMGVKLAAHPGITIDPEQDARLRRWAGLAFFLAWSLTLASGFSFGGLLLARASRQLDEVRLKRALGANAARLIGELSAGPLAVVSAGYFGAIALTIAAETAMQHQLEGFGRAWMLSRVDTLLALLSQLPLVFLVAVIMALIPAARLLRESGAPRSSYAATGTKRANRILQSVVVAQIICCICSCIVAAMVARSAQELGRQSLGFRPENRTVLAIGIRRGVTHLEFSTDSKGTFPLAIAADNIRHQLAAFPQVRSVAMAMAAPLDPSAKSMALHKLDSQTDESWTVNYNGVTPSYFKTLGTSLIAGHEFTDGRMTGDPTEVVINQALEKQLWPKQNAVGKSIRLDDPSGLTLTVEVIGIVSDQRSAGPKNSPAPTVYLPLRGNIFIFSLPVYVLVEGQQPVFALEAVINRAIVAQMPGLNVSYSYLVSDRLRSLNVAEEQRVWFAGTGAIAIALVAYIGLYSSLTYFVNTRRRELAIRASCGATPRKICAIVLSQALQSGGIAAGISLLCWGFLRRLVGSDWVGALWSNTVAMEVIFVCLLAVVLISIVPSLRASQISPATALRE